MKTRKTATSALRRMLRGKHPGALACRREQHAHRPGLC
jgi:hypothetical protein